MSKLLPWIAVLVFASAAVAQPPGQRGQSEMAPMMQQMQARMQAMHAQMERIRQTEDPAERQRLMQAHREAMRESMGMMGRMMREEPMQQRRAMGECPAGDTECRMQRMEARQAMMAQRMQMMHQMMEQMMGAMPEVEQPAEDGAHDEHH